MDIANKLSMLHKSAIFLASTLLLAAVTLSCRTLMPLPAAELNPVQAVDTTPTSFPTGKDVTVTTDTTYYEITGDTAQELRDEMSRLGPPDLGTGKIFDARTDWNIQWNFYFTETGDECLINRANVTIAITYIYPKWQQPASAIPSLVNKWNNYVKALHTHESEHASMAIAAGYQIYDVILAMPESSCNILEVDTNARAYEVMDELDTRQQAYDEQTDHGLTQGAYFP